MEFRACCHDTKESYLGRRHLKMAGCYFSSAKLTRLSTLEPFSPGTAPPHSGLEDSLASGQTMRALRPSILSLTHFGAHHDPPAVFDHPEGTLRRWDKIVRAEGIEAAGAAVMAENLPPAGTPGRILGGPTPR